MMMTRTMINKLLNKTQKQYIVTMTESMDIDTGTVQGDWSEQTDDADLVR